MRPVPSRQPAGHSFPGLLDGSLAYAPTLAVLAKRWPPRRCSSTRRCCTASTTPSAAGNTLKPPCFWHLLNSEVLVLSSRALLQSDGRLTLQAKETEQLEIATHH
jgi:hypothetical protein